MCCTAAVLLTLNVNAYAQQLGCPGQGWAEGLPADLGPKAQFPVNDTLVRPNGDKTEWVYPEDCAFHQWSWEAFIWATNIYWKYPPSYVGPAVRQPRFLSLNSQSKLSVSNADTSGKLILLPRTLKPGSRIKKFQQAGPGGILVDQQHEAVFYSVHMNDAYFDFTKKYYGKSAYKGATSTEQYPVGSAIFKAAWKIVSKDDTAAWFTTSAIVPVLVQDGDKIIPDPSGKTRDVTVSLVGLHVVGVTQDHPEFIWATFEHYNNAPDLPSSMKFDSADPVSDQDYTFYKANTAAKDSNQLVKLTSNKGKLSPITNVYRQFARGGLTKLPANEFDSINTQARGEMKALAHPQEPGIPAYPDNTVWSNYKLIGTTWQPVPYTKYPTPVPPTIVSGDESLFNSAIGCIELEDSTMETFVQGPQNNAGSPSNCFMCHNTAGNSRAGYTGKLINISHVILAPFFE